MEIFLYIMLFIMGTFFGSFFTLAVYRIPLKKDITHERSFCPKCNHKLNFLDLIPVWSYIFLKGKCRYCGEKVRIRYLILEVLSGIVFVIAFMSLGVSNIYLEYYKIIEFISFVLMYVTLVLVGGIDKEYRKVNFSVLVFGAVTQLMYILYLYMIDKTSIYRYSIYFAIFILLLIIDILVTKKKENYLIEITALSGYILAVLGIGRLGIILGVSLVICEILHLCKKNQYGTLNQIPIGFVISVITIVYKIIENFVCNFA